MPTLTDYDMSPTSQWPGLAKLVEEMGELQVELMRLIAMGGDANSPHWDGLGPLRSRILDELADVRAAVDFFHEINFLRGSDKPYFDTRVQLKRRRYAHWHENGNDDLPEADVPVRH